MIKGLFLVFLLLWSVSAFSENEFAVHCYRAYDLMDLTNVDPPEGVTKGEAREYLVRHAVLELLEQEADVAQRNQTTVDKVLKRYSKALDESGKSKKEVWVTAVNRTISPSEDVESTEVVGGLIAGIKGDLKRALQERSAGELSDLYSALQGSEKDGGRGAMDLLMGMLGADPTPRKPKKFFEDSFSLYSYGLFNATKPPANQNQVELRKLAFERINQLKSLRYETSKNLVDLVDYDREIKPGNANLQPAYRDALQSRKKAPKFSDLPEYSDGAADRLYNRLVASEKVPKSVVYELLIHNGFLERYNYQSDPTYWSLLHTLGQIYLR